jgi:YHS domain-containing protein
LQKLNKLNGGDINMVIDPICNMNVDEKTAEYVSMFKGIKYYFCSPLCKKIFDENPDKYSYI